MEHKNGSLFSTKNFLLKVKDLFPSKFIDEKLIRKGAFPFFGKEFRPNINLRRSQLNWV